jgi:hypothetical protein
MKRAAAAVCLSLASLAAMAQSEQKPLTVQVDLLRDTQPATPVSHMDSVVLKDRFGVLQPFGYRTGGIDGDTICTKTVSGDTTTTKLTTRAKFVGLSIDFKPMSEHDGKIFGHLTVQNTMEIGHHNETDLAGCMSRYVDTAGLSPTSLDIVISTGAETVVPIVERSGSPLSDAPHYTLRIQPSLD